MKTTLFDATDYLRSWEAINEYLCPDILEDDLTPEEFAFFEAEAARAIKRWGLNDI